MKFNVIKLLFVSLLLTIVQLSHAQEEPPCLLPAPEDVYLISSGPDFIETSWTPVPGAIGYNITIIDLDSYTILHSSDVFTPDFSLFGVFFPENTIFEISSICEDFTYGEPLSLPINPIVMDDLVLQIDFLGAESGLVKTKAMICTTTSPNQQPSILPATNPPSPNAHITFPGGNIVFTTLVEVIGDGSNSNIPDAFSLFLLSRPRGGVNNSPPSVWFAQSHKKRNIQSNTERSALGSNKIILKGTSTNVYEYAINTNKVDFTIDAAYVNGPGTEINTYLCSNGEHRNFSNIDNTSEALRSFNQGGTLEAMNSVKFIPRTQFTPHTPFKLSPNPASNKLNINLPTEGSVEILDVNGRVWYKKYTSNKQTELAIANWPAGIYIIRYDGKDHPIVERFIKL